MKIEQQATEYRPITIVLENAREAKNFIALIDRALTHEGVTIGEAREANKISNAFSNDLVLP